VLAVVPVGVPEITPVELSKFKFCGSDPADRLHVKGAVPPAACKASEYGSFIVPGGSDGVRIVRTGGLGTTLKCRIL
jgi:hypothetical protein